MSVSVFRHNGREGSCHRCGWTTALRTVTRKEAAAIRRTPAARLRTGFRWLCEECIADLTPVEQSEGILVHAHSFRPKVATAPQHRSVA